MSHDHHLVPNPMYQELKTLHSELQRDADTMGNALREASHRMGSGKVWTSPSATAWGHDLDGHARDLRRSVDRALEEVQRALSRTPEKVTQQEAWVNSRMMAGRM